MVGALRHALQTSWHAMCATIMLVLNFLLPHSCTVCHRRQELVLIGVRLNGKAVTAALDACLCSEAEMEASAAGQLADPFLEWPSLQQILDAGDEDEDEDEEEGEDGEVDTERASRLSTVEEGEEEAAPAPGSVHDVAYGAAELQEMFDAAAVSLAQPGGPPVLGVVSWHAAWCEPCVVAAAALRQLAAAHPAAAFFSLDVEGSAANTAFALEKVMRKPESRRAGGGLDRLEGGGAEAGCLFNEGLDQEGVVAVSAGEQGKARHAPASAHGGCRDC